MTTPSLFKPARLLALALSLTSLQGAHADVVFNAPLDLLLNAVNASGNLIATAGLDLSTAGSSRASGQCKPSAGRDATPGDLTAEGKLSVSTASQLTVTGPLVAGPQHTTGTLVLSKDQR